MAEKDFVLRDSGERREYNTGSVRDRQVGKGRFDLIPSMPIRRLAKLYEAGAVKYGPNNWRKGQPLSASFLDSMQRHVNCLVAGEPTEDHAAAILWNTIGFMWTLEEIEAGRLPKELDDRAPPEPQYEKHAAVVQETVADEITPIDYEPRYVESGPETIEMTFSAKEMRFHELPRKDELTEHEHEAIAELEKLGFCVNVLHGSNVLELSRKPVPLEGDIRKPFFPKLPEPSAYGAALQNAIDERFGKPKKKTTKKTRSPRRRK